MKLDKFFQSLLLTGAVVVVVNTPAKGEEVREDIQSKSSTQKVGESALDEKVAVTEKKFASSKSPVLAPSIQKSRLFKSQLASSLQRAKSDKTSKNIRQISEIELPATSAQMLVQTPTPTNPSNPEPRSEDQVVAITSVKANATNRGVEVILETTQGTRLQVTNRSAGNNFIADVSGGQLRLPSGEAFTFRSEKPTAVITEITVTNIDANTVRVTVVGEKALPTVELFDDDAGLVFGITSAAIATQPPQQPQTPQTQEKPASETPQEQPTAPPDQPIELVVTGEQDGYNVRNATTATKTDTPLRDIPQSIQVIPNQVIRDQNVNRLQDAVRNNAPGVSQFSNQSQAFVIRGFRQDFNLRNGFRSGSTATKDVDLADVDHIEVLRGPASVLLGQLQPGGVINTVTKQPLSEPYYSVKFTGGQFSFYRPELDLSGPLTNDGSLKYRLNLAYQNNGSFRDFVSEDRFFVAPVLQWNIGKNTTLTVDFSYTYNNPTLDYGVVALSDGSLVLPINRALFYPSLDQVTVEQYQASYRLEHKFSDNWQLRNGFSFYSAKQSGGYTYVEADFIDDRFLDKLYADDLFIDQDYRMQTDLTGKFTTGSIRHQLLIGFELGRSTNYFTSGTASLPTIDIFNPNYNVTRPDVQIDNYGTTFTDTLGIYIQDQIDITDNLHLLVGGRFDFTKQYDSFGTFSQADQAFSPRVGIVYQPIKPISLYASYSQSFNPVIGRSRTNSVFEPERGTQYEVGIKADITNTVSATLAAFEITKSNVLTSDPVDPINFSIQVGEQRSRGVEFTIGGEILPGWNILAGYAYTDARVTEDNRIPVGTFLRNVPKNAANLWTTYEIQSGDYKGLGFGLGLVFVGEQQADFPNSNFQIPSYVRTDAALFYRRDNWRLGINVNNLFDVEYYEAASRRTIVYPGAPVNVQATISYEF
ncbi:TonB-dependent siderophore receptor [Nostoc sp.]|uniref:TonB-dependent siderophore receptor n=1 Tax=Nostoc sp. TaxID=1180 RepID=UPI002FF45002